MIGVVMALTGALMVSATMLFARLRVRSVFGVYDEWTQTLAEQTVLGSRWYDGVVWVGWTAVAFGVAIFVTS